MIEDTIQEYGFFIKIDQVDNFGIDLSASERIRLSIKTGDYWVSEEAPVSVYENKSILKYVAKRLCMRYYERILNAYDEPK